MSFAHLLKYALSLSPTAAARGGSRYIRRLAHGSWDTLRQSPRCSLLTAEPNTLVNKIVSGVLFDSPPRDHLVGSVDYIIDHQFDLLGSGLVKTTYGMQAKGFASKVYPAQSIDSAPSSLISRVNPGNQRRASAIRSLISPDYNPIDWHLDFKSGYRWCENVRSGSIRYGHKAGVDIKVPWELARLQHLPTLALAGLNSDEGNFRLEFENQVLDFIAANPPGWGVNWVCTMDVAIRAANMVLAYALFSTERRPFEKPFHGEFVASMRAHGRHIVRNLEWDQKFHGNHYLANIAGLTFIAAFLPSDLETDTWLAFSIQQLMVETDVQFLDDGSNFEASTSYHRLSAELVVYATSVILGLPESRQTSVNNISPASWPHAPKLRPGAADWHDQFGPFSMRHFARLRKMAAFSMAVTKPQGDVLQIGDNDDGRFFKFYKSGDLPSKKNAPSLDHRSLVGAIAGLIDDISMTDFVGSIDTFETRLVRSLSGRSGCSVSGEAPPLFIDRPPKSSMATHLSQIDITLPDVSLTDDLTAISYPDFGLFIWRSERLFLSVRCGSIGQNGRGGHAHNDQLAIELQVDGEDWIADPGAYVYTADPGLRDAYRSTFAHSTPRLASGEPSSLSLGMFRLEDNANARTLHFSKNRFHGVHDAYGQPIFRNIEIGAGKITLLDGLGGEQAGSVVPHFNTVRSGKEARDVFGLTLPFSAGYGRRQQSD